MQKIQHHSDKELICNLREKALRLSYENAGSKVFRSIHEEIDKNDLDDLFDLAELNFEFIMKEKQCEN